MAIDHSRLDKVVLEARKARETREQGYREKALKMYPWVCGRCARSFDYTNVIQLTVHHRNHNHDHNPPDGSNWELLCLYCHDNEHQKRNEVDQGNTGTNAQLSHATHNPFAALKSLLESDGKE